ncbi:Phenylalanyl-tRNA synthetase alpha subunit [Lactobacillus gasseri CECT 5714]|nr:Phenylalanyl-tRNA synthetase alpha subunit [Lactobacillus gasseri CECT 5714]
MVPRSFVPFGTELFLLERKMRWTYSIE